MRTNENQQNKKTTPGLWWFWLTASLSIIAIMISGATLILTSPLIVDYLSRPELVWDLLPLADQQDSHIWILLVRNVGKSAAEGVEIQLTALPSDFVEQLSGPRVHIERIHQGGPSPFSFDRVYITASRLVPNDDITIILGWKSEDHDPGLVEVLGEFPKVGTVLYSEGQGVRVRFVQSDLENESRFLNSSREEPM